VRAAPRRDPAVGRRGRGRWHRGSAGAGREAGRGRSPCGGSIVAAKPAGRTCAGA
jgi:hypothetical protein